MNREEERKNLINILSKYSSESRCERYGNPFGDDYCKGCKYESEKSCEDSNRADYLLENGVIVPPVKVGQTVYGISRGAIIPISVAGIQYSNRGIDILGRNERYFGSVTITLQPDNEFGIEWYTTKEQAEKALKGGEDDG